MEYIVRITRTTRETRTTKEWKKVADSGNERDGGAVYDYVPTSEEREVEHEVYSQRLDELDLAALVALANGVSR